MADFEPARDLEKKIARMLTPTVTKVAELVGDQARKDAPGTKTWQTAGDALVRPEHRDVDGQEVPDNLRYVVDSPAYDQTHYGAPPRQQLREPRDPDATPGLTENCRCGQTHDPEGLARHIKVHPAHRAGLEVKAAVTAGGPRVIDAEFGTGEDEGARFLGGAASKVARRLR